MIRRFLFFLAVVAAVYLPVQGGQWSTWDLFTQRRQKQALLRANDSLQRKVDSLRRYRAQLDTDRALQEKLARENLGMVRGDKELVYQIGADTSGKKKPPSP